MEAGLFSLQNGSDVRGVALEIPGGRPVNLTAETAGRIAGGFAIWLSRKLGRPEAALTVGVGHDSRLTAGVLKQAVCRGLAARGTTCADCGLASTPAMFMGTVFPETGFDGAVMITASHLPRERNGLKFFTRAGGLDKPDVRAVLELADALPAPEGKACAAPCGLMGLYAASLRGKIAAGVGGERPLAGLRLVVDAGNGVGGFFVRDVLEPLGADCTGSQFLEPDGSFPNHAPNPEDKAAMDSLRAAVLANGADLGIIFDTDGDRMSAVLSDGREVNRDAIIAMMAAILAPDYPGSTIVTDSVTSDRLTAFLEGLGLTHRRFKRGYRNVINESVRLNAEGVCSPLAIETSGHGALRENYFLDDGAYMAVKLITAAAKAGARGEGLEGLIAALPPAGEAQERRIPIEGADTADYGALVLEAFRARAEARGLTLAQSCEGVRLTWPGEGWLLLRLSLHDPLLPLNVESLAPGGCRPLLDTARALLTGFDRLDLSALD
ncbi:phosphoglucomutase [Oscillospiraceae bacterium]|nr:phosphoglucomutase [Oscillospiraceae bacterium]BDF73588.1 phosphoglucomutase [Oscillospiraceae bacterium]